MKTTDIIKNKYVRQALFTLAATLFVGLAFTMADFYEMPYKNLKDLLIIVLQFGVIETAVFLLIWLLSCNKYVFAFTFPLLITVCAVATYFRYTANLTLTPMAIELAMINDVRTSMDVVTLPLIATTIIAIIASVGFVVVRFRYIKVGRAWLQAAAAIVLLNVLMSIPSLARPINYRIPFVIYDSITTFLDNRKVAAEERPAFKGNIVCDADTIDVVFIIGETLRSKNMQINGYQRPTTPYLVKEESLVSLPNIWSEYGFTHNSIPYIMTRANHKNPDIAYEERSFVDIFKQAGYRTTWIANQESVLTFIYFMNEADSLIYLNSGKSLYVYDQWVDGDILPELDKQLSLQKNDSKRLFVLHTIGSHWWYKSHYTRQFARWKPELKSRVLSSNSKEEFFNSYDNTVLYSDWFWQEVRNKFRSRNAIVIYLSDHAENLGENGVFGHGEDTDALHHPGCWIWMSDKYRATHPDKWKALNKNSKEKHNSAFLFHSIIDAGDIKTQYIDKQYNIFR